MQSPFPSTRWWRTIDGVNAVPDSARPVTSILRDFASMRGGLLPALHAIQHEHGYIDNEDIPALADTFSLSVAEVQIGRAHV